MTNVLINIETGIQINIDELGYDNPNAFADKLIKTGKYIYSDDVINVSVEQGLEVLENERKRLVAKADELDEREKRLNELINELQKEIIKKELKKTTKK